MSTGWVKIHRTISTHWVFQDSEKFKAWIIILLTVNYEDKKVNIGNLLFDCKRGESLLSLDSWAKKFGNTWNKSKVRRFFDLLQKDSMIVLINEHKTTRLIVCNYETYQDERNASDTHTKRIRNASDTQMTPTKETKEIKEIKEIKEQIVSFCKNNSDEVFLSFEKWRDYLIKQHDVSLKENEYTYQILLKTIKEYGAEKTIENIKYSITRNWKQILPEPEPNPPQNLRHLNQAAKHDSDKF